MPYGKQIRIFERMKIKRLTFFVITGSLLAGCGSAPHRAAPMIDYGQNSASRTAEAATKSKQPEGRGYYTVKKGDTLYRIALEFGQNWRDIVAWNHLQNANDIKVDQLLRVLPPETNAAANGAQTGSVATASSVEVRPLNNAAPAAAAANGPVPHKTGPRGDKRPYSDAALAELQKPEAAPAANHGKAETRNESAAEAKTPAPADAAPAADETIKWMWPAEGRIVAAFSSGKKGIDIAGKMGQPVYAAGAGKVLYASSVRGYGNLVIIKHSASLLSAYAHNKTILVKEGQTVNKGQKIAEMGNSDTDSVKLHFEIRQQGKPVDPSKFLPSR